MKGLALTVGYDAKRAVQNMTGLGNYSRFVIDVMSGRYPQNQYVLFAPSFRENPRLQPLLMRENIRVVTPSGALSRRLKSWWRSVEMVHDWPREGIDLYHGLSNELPLTSGLAPCPTVVTIHDLIWRRVPGDYTRADRALYELKYRRSAKIATRIIAISERTKQDIVTDWDISPDKIDVIYQGCHPAFSKPVSVDERMGVRQRYSLPERYILTVGTVQSRKNQLLAVKALSGLPSEIKLIVAGGGDGAYRREIEQYIQANRLSDRVIFLQSVPLSDLPALYSGAVLSSYTSRYEGFGIPVVESLSVGTPVIACTGSCLEEAGGDGALYVDPDDAAAFVEAAKSIMEKPRLRDRLAERGLRHVKKFNDTAFAEATMKTYTKAILDYNLK